MEGKLSWLFYHNRGEELAVQMLAYVFPIFPRAAMQLPDHATVQLLQNQVQEDLAVAV